MYGEFLVAKFHVFVVLVKFAEGFTTHTRHFRCFADRNNDGFVDKDDIEVFKRVIYDMPCNTIFCVFSVGHQTLSKFSLPLQKLRTYMEQVHGHALKDRGYKAAYDDYWTLMHEISDTNRDGKLSRWSKHVSLFRGQEMWRRRNVVHDVYEWSKWSQMDVLSFHWPTLVLKKKEEKNICPLANAGFEKKEKKNICNCFAVRQNKPDLQVELVSAARRVRLRYTTSSHMSCELCKFLHGGGVMQKPGSQPSKFIWDGGRGGGIRKGFVEKRDPQEQAMRIRGTSNPTWW